MQSAAGFVGNEGQVPDTDHEERCQDSILHQIRQKKFAVSGRDAGGIAGVSSARHRCNLSGTDRYSGSREFAADRVLSGGFEAT